MLSWVSAPPKLNIGTKKSNMKMPMSPSLNLFMPCTFNNNYYQTDATSIVGGEPDHNYMCLYNIVCNQCLL